MKKYNLFLFSLLFIGFQLFGKSWQMTYDSHGLIADEINNMKLTSYINPGVSGLNQTWDFSALKVNSDFQGTVNNSVYSELYNKLLATNVVLKEFSNEFYFSGDKRKLELHGVASNGDLVIKYDNPFVKMKYPFNYGESFSGVYSGVRLSNGVSNGSIDGTYDVVADGYGSVLLPNNLKINDVLKVTTTRNYNQVINNYTTKVTHTTTRFYVNHYRFPLVVMIQSNYNGRTSTRAAYNDKIENLMQATDIVESGDFNSELKLYPNPVSELLNIEYSLNKNTRMVIEVFNVVGERIYTIMDKTQPAGNYKIPFALKDNNINAGTYYVNINGKTEKIVVK